MSSLIMVDYVLLFKISTNAHEVLTIVPTHVPIQLVDIDVPVGVDILLPTMEDLVLVRAIPILCSIVIIIDD